VFHQANALAIHIYHHTATFPFAEKFGLQSQLRRAAVSVATNIVEGSARRSRADYGRFIDMALASANEVDYLLDLSSSLGFGPVDSLRECKNLTGRLTPGLQKLLDSIDALDQSPPGVRRLEPGA